VKRSVSVKFVPAAVPMATSVNCVNSPVKAGGPGVSLGKTRWHEGEIGRSLRDRPFIVGQMTRECQRRRTRFRVNLTGQRVVGIKVPCPVIIWEAQRKDQSLER
jgi:hypothetical protein